MKLGFCKCPSTLCSCSELFVNCKVKPFKSPFETGDCFDKVSEKDKIQGWPSYINSWALDVIHSESGDSPWPFFKPLGSPTITESPNPINPIHLHQRTVPDLHRIGEWRVPSLVLHSVLTEGYFVLHLQLCNSSTANRSHKNSSVPLFPLRKINNLRLFHDAPSSPTASANGPTGLFTSPDLLR